MIINRIFLLAALSLLATSALAISPGEFDDFEDATTEGWENGAPSPNPPINVGDGGPDGVGDAYVQNSSSGGFGPGSRQIMYNLLQWTGDYLAAGVNGISVDLANFGAGDLFIRIAVEGIDGSRYGSSDAVVLPSGGAWQNATFSLSGAAMSLISGTATLESVLSDVVEFRILSAQAGPAWQGDAIVATLGADNITAVGGPDCTDTSLLATIDGDQSGTGSTATGSATMTFDATTRELAWNIAWSGLEGTISVAHFHGPALPGMTAGIQVNFGQISGLTSPSVGSAILTSSQAADLLAGLWYINIHSNLFPSGEIRGQVEIATNTVAVDGEVLSCSGTCNSFAFLDAGSTINGGLVFDQACISDGTFTGADVVDVAATILNPDLPLVGPSDPPDPLLDNPFTLDPSVGGGAIVVANGQQITNPRGTFTSAMSSGTTDGETITGGFVDLWLTEGILAENGAVIRLNYTDDCSNDLAATTYPAPCFEVGILEGLASIAAGTLAPVVSGATSNLALLLGVCVELGVPPAVIVPLAPGDTSYNCSAQGFAPTSGAVVISLARGVANCGGGACSSIGLEVTGLAPVTATCTNLTTGQAVSIGPPVGGTSLDCSGAGLNASQGNLVNILVISRAE